MGGIKAKHAKHIAAPPSDTELNANTLVCSDRK
jgi:hypothetical protein